MSEIAKFKTKRVYVVMQNEDLTEGRGFQRPIAVCESPTTARWHARGKGVMGANCPIVTANLIEIGGRWYGEVGLTFTLIYASKDDLDDDEKIKKSYAVYEKMVAAGLSRDEIEAVIPAATLEQMKFFEPITK